MKTENLTKQAIFTLLGLAMLAIGLLLVKSSIPTHGILRTLPFILIGLGAGVFGENLGTILRRLALKKDPHLAKRIEIEEKDERTSMIRDKAKSRAYDRMLIVFGALMMAFALLQVDLMVILAIVAAYLFIVFTNIYYIDKYQKEL